MLMESTPCRLLAVYQVAVGSIRIRSRYPLEALFAPLSGNARGMKSTGNGRTSARPAALMRGVVRVFFEVREVVPVGTDEVLGDDFVGEEMKHFGDGKIVVAAGLLKQALRLLQ